MREGPGGKGTRETPWSKTRLEECVRDKGAVTTEVRLESPLRWWQHREGPATFGWKRLQGKPPAASGQKWTWEKALGGKRTLKVVPRSRKWFLQRKENGWQEAGHRARCVPGPSSGRR